MIKIEEEQKERAIVVGVIRPDQNRFMVSDYLDELELLADTAGAEIVERMVQERDRFDPAFMIGRGKVQELSAMTKYLDADLVIFDDDLTPAQVKNIEEVCKVKILDRSGLILDIFAKHARTREARTQVELAQLKYLLPRLTRQWTHLSRQVGGIGVRGPGETQLEVDRRMLRKRIGVLEAELEKIARQRSIRRKNRKTVFKLGLIGYTNVGKSTILNALTEADVLVEDRLFATLDSTIRSFKLSEHQAVLLIDTVGFIRKLPHHLVASFKSTLEEVSNADCLLHVIDITHPQFREQIYAVERVLSELKMDKKPLLKVFNKIDKLEDSTLIAKLKQTDQPCVFVSASQGIFLNDLKEQVKTFVEHASKNLQLVLAIQDVKVLPLLNQFAEVANITYEDDRAVIDLRATEENVGRINRLLEKENISVLEVQD